MSTDYSFTGDKKLEAALTVAQTLLDRRSAVVETTYIRPYDVRLDNEPRPTSLTYAEVKQPTCAGDCSYAYAEEVTECIPRFPRNKKLITRQYNEVKYHDHRVSGTPDTAHWPTFRNKCEKESKEDEEMSTVGEDNMVGVTTDMKSAGQTPSKNVDSTSSNKKPTERRIYNPAESDFENNICNSEIGQLADSEIDNMSKYTSDEREKGGTSSNSLKEYSEKVLKVNSIKPSGVRETKVQLALNKFARGSEGGGGRDGRVEGKKGRGGVKQYQSVSKAHSNLGTAEDLIS